MRFAHTNSCAFALHFPLLAPSYTTLLQRCANRFGLTVEKIASAEENGALVVKGLATIPLLRYIDFLPGSLHVDEILSSFNVTPISHPLPLASAADFVFRASAIQYRDYVEEPANDVHGLGCYLTLDRGLPLATLGHLIRFSIRENRTLAQAIKSFQEFSGWQKFDLRWDNEADKRAGVMVMPTISDASDLFERYEDEESDSDEDTLPFSIRPVAPCTPVPYMEDAILKKLRAHHWDRIVEFWKEFPTTRGVVVVTNCHDRPSLDDVLKLFEGLPVVEAMMVIDSSPQKRPRVFVTFADTDAARAALDMDGKNLHGKPLRVAVSPPYHDASRRGTVVTTFRKGEDGGNSPQEATPPPPPPTSTEHTVGKPPAPRGRNRPSHSKPWREALVEGTRDERRCERVCPSIWAFAGVNPTSSDSRNCGRQQGSPALPAAAAQLRDCSLASCVRCRDWQCRRCSSGFDASKSI